METFNQLLQEFNSVLQKYNLPNYERLYPSLPDVEVDARLAELGIYNAEIKIFYKWENGYDIYQNIETLCQVTNFGTFLSLDNIKYNNTEARKNRVWKDWFVPLVADSTGQYLLFNNKPGSDYGKIHLFSASLMFIETNQLL